MLYMVGLSENTSVLDLKVVVTDAFKGHFNHVNVFM